MYMHDFAPPENTSSPNLFLLAVTGIFLYLKLSQTPFLKCLMQYFHDFILKSL